MISSNEIDWNEFQKLARVKQDIISISVFMDFHYLSRYVLWQTSMSWWYHCNASHVLSKQFLVLFILKVLNNITCIKFFARQCRLLYINLLTLFEEFILELLGNLPLLNFLIVLLVVFFIVIKVH